jgi:hypothetical protein
MKLAKFKNFFKNNLLFYLVQILVLLFVVLLLNKNYLTSQNFSARSYLMQNRNNLLTSSSSVFEKNKDEIVLIGIDQKFFDEEKVSIQ